MPIPQTRPARMTLWIASAIAGASVCATADASMFAGETMDKVANGIAWVVLVLVPVVGITVFWLVHILPEKVAEKRRHPQAKAIQVLCLLSLVFGGLLWPLAWLWAYSKPVLYKMAYGTDVGDQHHGAAADASATVTRGEAARAEIEQLRARLATLEAQVSREARG